MLAHPHWTTTHTAHTHVYIEHALEPLCPAQPLKLARSWVRLFPSIGLYISAGRLYLANTVRCHTLSVPTVRRQYSMKSCEICSRLGHQCYQFGHEIQRLEHNVRRPIPIGCFQGIADHALICQLQPCLAIAPGERYTGKCAPASCDPACSPPLRHATKIPQPCQAGRCQSHLLPKLGLFAR